MAIIEVANVSFRYPGSMADSLQNISFNVDEHSFVTVLGPSGCGKSTLVRLLSGLSMPLEGEVRIKGERVTGPAPGRGIVLQKSGLFPWLTTMENVVFAISKSQRTLTRKECIEKAEIALEQVGLADARNLWPSQLSGGMAQRVSLARTLAAGAEILLLDEAFSALDPKNRRDLQNLLLSLWEKEKKTVVFVTHDVDEAIYMSDRILFLEPGKIHSDIQIPFERPRNREEVLTSNLGNKMRADFIAEFGRLGEAVDVCL